MRSSPLFDNGYIGFCEIYLLKVRRMNAIPTELVLVGLNSKHFSGPNDSHKAMLLACRSTVSVTRSTSG